MNLADLAARSSRSLFVPFVYRLAARMEQLDEKELLESATTLATALRSAQRLFGYDAIVSHFDLDLAALACGDLPAGRADQIVHQGRWPVVFEATRRLVKELGERVVVMGVVTGPLTLARQLGDESLERATEVAMALGRAYAECGAGALVVAEARALAPEEEATLLATLRPLWNLADYFQMTSILVARGRSLRLVGATSSTALRLVTLPESLFADPAEAIAPLIQRTVAEAGPGPLILGSPWEVPSETAPETLHVVIRVLKGGLPR